MSSFRANSRRLIAIVPLLLVAVIAAALAALPSDGKSPRISRDLHYSGPSGPSLDVYRPPGSGGNRPAVLVIHGGSWRAGGKADVASTARDLASAGFVALGVGYTLANGMQAGFPRQPSELRTAVRFVRRNAERLGVDPSRVGALGISAGAHLAALIATDARGPLATGERLGAVVTWSAPFELRATGLRRLLGRDIAAFLGCRACPRREAAASPTSHASRDDPPMLIVNSSHELIPAAQARRMARRLRAAGAPVRLWIVPGSLHAPLFSPTVFDPTVDFLRRHLR